MLIIAGIIHLLPLVGVLGASHLSSLYGVKIDDPNLLILMRHRAVLFVLLGAFLVYAAFRPSFQTVAILGGLLSTTAFLWLALSSWDYNESMTKVVYADILAIICLLLAATVEWFSRSA